MEENKQDVSIKKDEVKEYFDSVEAKEKDALDKEDWERIEGFTDRELQEALLKTAWEQARVSEKNLEYLKKINFSFNIIIAIIIINILCAAYFVFNFFKF